jgi:hypothetical protein
MQTARLARREPPLERRVVDIQERTHAPQHAERMGALDEERHDLDAGPQGPVEPRDGASGTCLQARWLVD